MHRLPLLPFALSAAMVFCFGCHRDAGREKPHSLAVAVSIPPQKYFVERIAGGDVHVEVMVGPGDSPETYEPKPSQLRALSHVDAYFAIGVPFEKAWLDRFVAANRSLRIFHTARNVDRIALRSRHAHAPHSPDRSAARLDPHIWLSPALVKLQARAIAEDLSAISPTNAAVYHENLRRFEGELDALDADIRKTLADAPSRKFMVFHPAWSYFAREYGLEEIPVEEGGQEPSAAELAHLISMAREEKIHVIFVQPSFSRRPAETIARQLGGRVAELDPLDADWANNLRRAASAIAQALTDS